MVGRASGLLPAPAEAPGWSQRRHYAITARSGAPEGGGLDPMNERARWQDRARPWGEWAPRLTEAAERFNRPLIEHAGIAAGHAVLDLASGAGEPALSLAAAVGPTGQVAALDLAPAMLANLTRRAAAAEVAPQLVAGDMEALPFAPQAFDRVTCRFGLMFASDPIAALAEARRVLRPGGRAAIMVWGPLAENSLFAAIEEAAAAAGLATEGAQSRRFCMAEPGRLAALFAAAGFAAVAEHELRFERRPRLDADPPFWRPQVAMACGDRLAPAAAPQRARFEQALRDGFARRAEDERVPLGFCARIGVGTAP
jgi:SAM-dependent methyltransferase